MAACGSDFTVAVTEDGELFAWGAGEVLAPLLP